MELKLDGLPGGVTELLELALTTQTKDMLASAEDPERIVEDVMEEVSNGSVEKLETLIRRRINTQVPATTIFWR